MIECPKKVEVQLFGSSGQTTVSVSSQSGTGHIPIPHLNDDHNIHSRAVFACLRDLETRFESAGIDRSGLPRDGAIGVFSVASLSELSESDVGAPECYA